MHFFFFYRRTIVIFHIYMLGCHSSLQVPQELFFPYQDHVTLRGSHEGWSTLKIEQRDREQDQFGPWAGKASLFCISSPSLLCFSYSLSGSSQTSCVISLVFSVTTLIDIRRKQLELSTSCLYLWVLPWKELSSCGILASSLRTGLRQTPSYLPVLACAQLSLQHYLHLAFIRDQTDQATVGWFFSLQ